MIRGQYVTDQDGRLLQYLEAWSPGGLAGLNRGKARRIRYTFVDVATGAPVDLWDTDAARVTLTEACDQCGLPAGYTRPGHHQRAEAS